MSFLLGSVLLIAVDFTPGETLQGIDACYLSPVSAKNGKHQGP